MIAPDSKGGTQNVWEDWRGNLYTVGSLVLYARMSGRSCELAEGRVVDLYEVYRNQDWKWVKVPAGKEAPLVKKWKCYDEAGEEMRCHGQGCVREDEVRTPADTERRAKIMPTMRTSRFNSYAHRNKKWVWDEKTSSGGYVDLPPEKIKPITLNITESITAVTPYDILDDM